MKIATDNGRSREFIRKRTYQDKSKCYECGDEGHLSYECPKNTLGYRKPPPKKKKRTFSDSQVNFCKFSIDGSESDGKMTENLQLSCTQPGFSIYNCIPYFPEHQSIFGIV